MINCDFYLVELNYTHTHPYIYNLFRLGLPCGQKTSLII